MRAAIFHPEIAHVGGAEKLVLEYLKRTDIEFDLYTWVYKPEKTYEEFQTFDPIPLLKKPIELRPRTLFRMVTAVLGSIKELPKNYDTLVISNAGLAEFMLYKNKMKYNISYTHTPLRLAHPDDQKWMFKIRTKNPLKKLLLKTLGFGYSILEKPAYRMLDGNATNSKLVMERLKKKGLIGEKTKTKVIYPGVEIPRGKKARKSTEETIKIVHVSRLSYIKRQEEAILAVNRLREKYGIKNVELHIVGSESEKKYAEKIKSYMNKFKWLNITTDVNEKEKWEIIQDSDIGLFTAWNEDFGIVPLEYMAAGLPIVGTPGGYYEIAEKIDYPMVKIREPELYSDIHTIVQDTIENITSALYSAIKNIDKLKEEAKKGRERFMKLDLSWERFTKEFDSFILSIVR